MDPSASESGLPPTPAPPQWLSLPVASCNLLNLALPERSFYDNQPPYDEQE